MSVRIHKVVGETTSVYMIACHDFLNGSSLLNNFYVIDGLMDMYNRCRFNEV